MESIKSKELITLEVLGCLNERERESFRIIKETDENFPWEELARYQNLAAQLPATLTAPAVPSSAAKEKMLNKLNSSLVISGKKSEPEKFVPGVKKQDSVEKELESVLEKNKINWDSLTVAETIHKDPDGFKEVRSKASTIKKDLLQENKGFFKSEESTSGVFKKSDSEFSGETDLKTSSKLKKYILAASVLFVISVSLFVYMMLRDDSTSHESTIIAENTLSDTIQQPVEEFVYNELEEFENTQEVTPVKIVETTTKNETEKIVLPKAPPKLPDPIEAPLTEVAEVVEEETPKVVEEQAPTSPPKEVIEVADEPTYFVAVEEMPQPVGGLQEIQSKIVYPEIAKRAGIEGKVFVRAYVDEDGNVTTAELVKGIGGGCDEAALNAILSSKFTPGKQRGKPIKVQVTIPIVFKL